MATMTAPDLDRRIRYRPAPGNPEGICRLRVFHAERVAVVTEVEDNPGMSVTNAIEAVGDVVEQVLAMRVAPHRGLGPAEQTYQLIEHYPAAQWRGATIDAVRFSDRDGYGRLRTPAWSHVARTELAWLWDSIEPGEA